MNELTNNYVKSKLRKREIASNKSDHGHALIIAGRQGFMGAAVISAKACLRSGVGLLTVSVPRKERFILQISIPEAMVLMREEQDYSLERYSAIGIGPGLGTDKKSREILTSVVKQSKTPLVLDADALTIISKNKKVLMSVPAESVLTPHTGEFDRLFGKHANNDERIITATNAAREFNLIIVLKGMKTAIITASGIYYNTTGNAGLAKGGSGDALTGIITSFIAQGYTPLIAAQLGVYIHGLAADLSCNQQSVESMLITDVIENLGKAFEAIRV